MTALFLFHAAVFAACYVFAWQLRFEFDVPPFYLPTFRMSLPVVMGVQLLAGALFGFYKGWWRYVGIGDVVRLVIGQTTALTILAVSWYVGPLLHVPDQFVREPRGVLLIDWAFALLTLFGARVAIRMGQDRFGRTEVQPREQKRVLIVGAGDAGEALAREIEHRPQLGIRVVGFVDDQRAKWGAHIRGVRVTGPIGEIGRIADAANADEAFIAIPSASGKRLREIISFLSAADLKFKTMPGMDQVMSGRVHVTQLRPVNVEDLMRRKRIELPGDPVRQMFHGRRVLITGAGGSIGSELASQILDLEPESMALVERSEYSLYECNKRLMSQAAWLLPRVSCNLIDIQDSGIIEEIVSSFQPHIVLHAAAHKHVPLGEQNPAEYVRNNTLATRALAAVCERSGVDRFVFVSTDKAINPTSVMGASKRAAEIGLIDLLSERAMKLTIVRFGNVIGSSRSVVPLFLEQIAAGGPVTVTHPEVTRYFLRTSEAVSLVLQAAAVGTDGHVFMLDMGEPVKIVDLARDMIRLSNHTEEEIPIVFTGLRPGEKLFEEVRLEAESIKPTVHPHIVVTGPPQPAPYTVGQWLRDADARLKGPPSSITEWLSELVPEYKPLGSDAPAAPEVATGRALRLVPTP